MSWVRSETECDEAARKWDEIEKGLDEGYLHYLHGGAEIAIHTGTMPLGLTDEQWDIYKTTFYAMNSKRSRYIRKEDGTVVRRENADE